MPSPLALPEHRFDPESIREISGCFRQQLSL
jgi:hypothetical protein